MSRMSNQPNNPAGAAGVGVANATKFDHLDPVMLKVAAGFRVRDILEIRPRTGAVSQSAQAALRTVASHKDVKQGEEKARAVIADRGLSTPIADASKRINAMGLDDSTRLLLSNPDVYGTIVLGLLEAKKVSPTDVVGFADAVLRELESDNGLKAKFVAETVKDVIERNSIDLDADHRKSVEKLVRSGPLPAAPGDLEKTVLSHITRTISAGNLPDLIDEWAKRKEIDQARLTPSIRSAMVRFLRDRGVNTKRPNVLQMIKDAKYDEYFALAYDRAVTTADGSADPVTAAATGALGDDWDFTVDTFETIEEQGVVATNILAAGALDYNFELGERLGVFRLTDAVVLNWAAGAVDVAGDIEKKLYRYNKLRDTRFSEEERGMMYKRVLNKGEAEVMSRTVVNESFTELWDRLMYEAAQYIRKTEESGADTMEDSKVSRTPIYEATRLLQYNLTEFCTGMAHVHARETYAALQAAIEILKDPEVAAHYGGGRRGTLWTTIERLSRQEFGVAPNIAALRTLAVDGNRIFRWIAEFQRGTVTEDAFRDFLEAAESYVLAKATVEDTLDTAGMDEGDEAQEDSMDHDEFGELDE